MNKTHQEMTELLDAMESTEKQHKIKTAKMAVFYHQNTILLPSDNSCITKDWFLPETGE